MRRPWVWLPGRVIWVASLMRRLHGAGSMWMAVYTLVLCTWSRFLIVVRRTAFIRPFVWFGIGHNDVPPLALLAMLPCCIIPFPPPLPAFRPGLLMTFLDFCALTYRKRLSLLSVVNMKCTTIYGRLTTSPFHAFDCHLRLDGYPLDESALIIA
jgi:hypothetical protein